eukprot:scaffold77250_cov25-Prasinocladus_malaysianus.AAC.1
MIHLFESSERFALSQTSSSLSRLVRTPMVLSVTTAALQVYSLSSKLGLAGRPRPLRPGARR